MKRILPTLALLLFTTSGFCQSEYWERIHFESPETKIGVSPSEQIWIATHSGQAFYTNRIGELWHVWPGKSFESLSDGFGGKFEGVNFLSEDTLIITGQIHNQENKDVLLWSGNHGKTWEKIDFGARSTISTVFDREGAVWMGGSAGQIFYSSNYGRNWGSLPNSANGYSFRYPAIFYSKDLQLGLLGSDVGELYRTDVQGNHWEQLPTPESQAKHPRFELWEKTRIGKIQATNGNYICKQAGRVFISRQDSVDWKYVPGVLDFEVAENGGVYLINRDLTTSFLDSNLAELWHSPQTFDGSVIAIAERNNSLFVLTKSRIYKVNPNEFISSELFTDDVPIRANGYNLRFEGHNYNFDNKDILRFNRLNKKWYRYLSFDSGIGNVLIFEGKLIFSKESTAEYYVINTKEKKIEKFDLPTDLFKDKIVKTVYFEKGFGGCFNMENTIGSYVLEGDHFEFNPKSSSRDYHPGPFKRIEKTAVDSLVEMLDNSKNAQVVFEDLEITLQDIEYFKMFLNWTKNNPPKPEKSFRDYESWERFQRDASQFEYFKIEADSLYFLGNQQINEIFLSGRQDWSTSYKFKRVVFCFEGGEQVMVENDYNEPNYLFSPWTANYKGLIFRINSIQFGKMIDRITQGRYIDEVARNKNYAIFQMLDYVRWQKFEIE